MRDGAELQGYGEDKLEFILFVACVYLDGVSELQREVLNVFCTCLKECLLTPFRGMISFQISQHLNFCLQFGSTFASWSIVTNDFLLSVILVLMNTEACLLPAPHVITLTLQMSVWQKIAQNKWTRQLDVISCSGPRVFVRPAGCLSVSGAWQEDMTDPHWEFT